MKTSFSHIFHKIYAEHGTPYFFDTIYWVYLKAHFHERSSIEEGVHYRFVYYKILQLGNFKVESSWILEYPKFQISNFSSFNFKTKTTCIRVESTHPTVNLSTFSLKLTSLYGVFCILFLTCNNVAIKNAASHDSWTPMTLWACFRCFTLLCIFLTILFATLFSFMHNFVDS